MKEKLNLSAYEEKNLAAIRPYLAECTVLLKKESDFRVKKPCRVALFGNGVRHTIKGGTGSGDVNSRYFVTVEEAFRDAGFQITSDEWLDAYDQLLPKAKADFAKKIKKEAKAKHQLPLLYGMGMVMPEPDYNIPLKVKSSKGVSESNLVGAGLSKSDLAVYVLSRISGEGNDRRVLPGDFYLTQTEIRTIIKLNKMFDRFVLVLNVGGPVDLAPVLDVKNILVLSQLGVDTGSILVDIILGKANPSGKLSTSWAQACDYSKIGEFAEPSDTRYREGIFVGYRYFDSVGKKPLFPFGYGLSFTEFEWTVAKTKREKCCLTLAANVKNIGPEPGKETIQAYLSIPSGKLVQPRHILCGFEKTTMLEAGETEQLQIAVNLADFASYSSQDQAYILEAGSYRFYLGSSSVERKLAAVVKLKEKIVVKKVKNLFEKPDFKDASFAWVGEDAEETLPQGISQFDMDAGDFPKTWIVDYDDQQAFHKYVEKPDEAITGKPEPTIEPAQDELNEVLDDAMEDEIESLVAGLSDEQLASLSVGAFDPKNSFANVIGNAGMKVCGAAGETSKAAKKEGIPVLVMADGPAGLRLAADYYEDKKGKHALGTSLPAGMEDMMGPFVKFAMKMIGGNGGKNSAKSGEEILHQYCTAIPIGTAIAQSFNPDFARLAGNIVGSEMKRFHVNLWLAPAMNIHRNVLCGRNFEYYSEDPLLAGKMAAAITRGVQAHNGCGVTIKHFAANNQETNRYNSNSMVSERALREIYLKPFEICVKEGKPAAVMTSYNLINGVHTSESKALCTDILRHEFGFDGLVMTDWVVAMMSGGKKEKYPGPCAFKAAKAGNDLFMPGSKKDYEDLLKALKKGSLSRKELERNVSRIAKVCQMLQ